MRTEFETVVAAFDDDSGIATLQLQRPTSLNAINEQLRKDIVAGLQWIERAPDESGSDIVRCVVLKGAKGNFCAGADVTEFGEDAPGMRPPRDHYRSIMDFPAPVVATIRGVCLGAGLETALACDLRLASADSQLGFPEVELGTIPGAGGIQFVSRLADPATAKELAMTGDKISGKRAASIGIVTRAFDADAFDERAESFVESLASKPPLALRAIKETAAVSTRDSLTGGRLHDRLQGERLLDSEDFREGLRAFDDDEYEPSFHGR
jgi:enoyl-CoA hydratase/carnithine racemase